MTDTTEIIELPPAATALEVYKTPKGLDPYINRIREEVTGHAADLTTKKGRDAIASRAFKVRKMKAALENLGKEQADKAKEIPKLIDAERKRMRDELDALADEVRKPLTEWEEAETNRVTSHKSGIEWFRLRGTENSDLDADELRATIAEVSAKYVGETWEEFEAEAHRVKAASLEALEVALAVRIKYEAEQAELAELRRKQAEQDQKDREAEIARQAAEKAKAEAEAKAKQEQEEAAKREADAKEAAERAEQERADAVERQKQAEARAEAEKLAAEKRAKEAAEAARQAEIKRQADEKVAEEKAAKKREADTKHKKEINNAALAAFIENGLPEECAKQAVILIAKGLIPAVKITY